jgi:WD40 repeat protein
LPRNKSHDAFIWNAEKYNVVAFQTEVATPNRTSVAVNTAGDVLAIGGRNGKIHFVSAIAGNALVSFPGHAGPVNGLDWLPDDSRLASAGARGFAKIWDTSTATELLALPGDSGTGFRGVKWSRDGRRLAAYGGKKVYIFGSADMETLQRRPARLETSSLNGILRSETSAPPSR